jgi:hypothetical protein
MKKTFIFLPVVLLLCCGFLGKKYDISAYHGDGSLTYIPKVGLLGSDGYRLTFERFILSEGCEKTFALPQLPVPSKGNDFCLHFKPDKKIPVDLLGTVQINTRLKEAAGNIVWDVQSTMANWTITTAGDHYSYYWYSHNSEPSFCKFIPDPAKTYYLEITFRLDPLSSDIPETGYFYLKAGGFK